VDALEIGQGAWAPATGRGLAERQLGVFCDDRCGQDDPPRRDL